MDKSYSEFTEEDWQEHFRQQAQDLQDLKELFHIEPHWLEIKSFRIGPSGIFFNEGGRLFSFVWWRGKILHLCLAILPHVLELYWLRNKGWKPELKHHNWRIADA